MKNIAMKNCKKIWILVIFTAFTIHTACDDDLNEIDNNPRDLSEEQFAVDLQNVSEKFRIIFQNIYVHIPTWQYQLQQNLNADSYSGYLTPPNPFVGGSNNTHYNLISGWNGFIWSIPYSRVMNNAKLIENLTREETPDVYAVSQILKITAMHRVTDVFGPIVYTKFGESATSSEYDSQEEVYQAFFNDIEEAIGILSDEAVIDNRRTQNFDRVYDGDYRNWIRYANSLRLRLAIRISRANPELAQAEAEKSLNSTFGLIETNDTNFIVDTGLAHPLVTISVAFADTRMNASMESILKGYQDPRISTYFTPIADPEITTAGDYKGIRIGMPLLSRYGEEPDQKAAYVGLSGISDQVMPNSVQLMTASEVAFLKAEAALRGWSNTGNAKENYENGMRLSFEQRGVNPNFDYITNDELTPMDYVDPLNDEFSIDALTDVTIGWDGADDNEERLEKIITQKWIAIFPQGQEAWSEYRRTGYPKIFPVASNQSGGVIDTDVQIRRIPFVDNEVATNPQGVSAARTKLKGPDNGGTRLWWDVEGGNF